MTTNMSSDTYSIYIYKYTFNNEIPSMNKNNIILVIFT